jgi:hypothetical protein
MAAAKASGTFRMHGGFVFISHQVENGSSIPDTTLKAERGQPVAARRFFGRELNSIPVLHKVNPGLQAGVEWTTSG